MTAEKSIFITLTEEDAAMLPLGIWWRESTQSDNITPLDPDRVYPDREYPRWITPITPPLMPFKIKTRVLVHSEAMSMGVRIRMYFMPSQYAGDDVEPGLFCDMEISLLEVLAHRNRDMILEEKITNWFKDQRHQRHKRNDPH